MGDEQVGEGVEHGDCVVAVREPSATVPARVLARKDQMRFGSSELKPSGASD